jgi:protoheme ferro-lyase
VRSALIDPDIEIVCLDGWNDHPQLIKAFAELTKEALTRL